MTLHFTRLSFNAHPHFTRFFTISTLVVQHPRYMGHNNISMAVYYGSLTSILLGYIKDHVHHIYPSYNDTACVQT